MPASPHLLLAVIALVCAVVSLVPFAYNQALLTVAVLLLAVAALLP